MRRLYPCSSHRVVGRLRPLLISALLLAVPACATPALAQDDARSGKDQKPGDEIEDLKERVRFGDEPDAHSAAMDLFNSGKPRYDGKHDAWLESIITGSENTTAAKKAVLDAVKTFGRHRPEVACRLARVGLSATDGSVRDAAAEALAAIELPQAYAFLRDALRELSNAGPAQARELDALINIIERKRDPVKATEVFVESLPVFDGADEDKIHAALRRLTGQTFESDDDWTRWFQNHRNVPQREWYIEALRSAEDDASRAQAAAERLFGKLLGAYGRDDAALLRELEDALAKESIPAIRVAAIRYLGEIGSRGGQGGERAIVLLEGLVKQVPKDSEDPTLRSALLGLGRTGRASELPLLLPFADHPSRLVRLAAATAIGAVRTDASVVPLVRALTAMPPLEKTDPEAAAIYARALGSTGRDPEGRSSAALLAFVERVTAENGNGNGSAKPSQRTTLLQAGAEALGGVGCALAPESNTAAAVVTALAALSEPAQNQDLRRSATSSLGQVPHQNALVVLQKRIRDESLNVRQAAIGAIGVQARRESAPEPLVRSGVAILAQELAGSDEALKRAAQAELELVVSRDKSTFVSLDALVESLNRFGAPDLAAPFLDGLPAPPAAPARVHARYWSLLEARAGARLRLSDGRGAVADYELLLSSQGPLPAPRQRLYNLGRARAYLAAGDARTAAERAAELARQDPRDDAAWSCLRAAADALLQKGDRLVVKEVFGSLDKVVAQASQESQAGYQDALRRADAPPQPRAPAPQPPAPRTPGSNP